MSDVSKTNDMLGFIDQTLYANEGGGWFWTNAEVIKLLHEIRAIATRVPVQGEPNDDRGALANLLDEIHEPLVTEGGCHFSGWSGGDFAGQRGVSESVDALIARWPRATVPDAATERERADLWRSLDWMLWGVGMGDVFREPLADKMIGSLSDEEFDKAQDLIRGWDKLRGGPIERNLFVELKAERDAALADLANVQKMYERACDDIQEYSGAIERVRAMVMQHRSIEQHNEMVPVSDIADLIREPSSAEYLAALDGAPEPEVKP